MEYRPNANIRNHMKNKTPLRDGGGGEIKGDDGGSEFNSDILRTFVNVTIHPQSAIIKNNKV
jgi:hypothetical protein